MLNHSGMFDICSPMDCSPLGSSIDGIFGQEYWSGLTFPTPGDLPYPRIKPSTLASPALASVFFTMSPMDGFPTVKLNVSCTKGI